jgi:hypothetical protein
MIGAGGLVAFFEPRGKASIQNQIILSRFVLEAATTGGTGSEGYAYCLRRVDGDGGDSLPFDETYVTLTRWLCQCFKAHTVRRRCVPPASGFQFFFGRVSRKSSRFIYVTPKL